MRRLLWLILLGLLSESLFGQEIGRRQTRYGFYIDIKPNLYCDGHVIYSQQDWQPVLRLRLRIQYDLLQFTKADNTYRADYDASVLIKKGENGEPLFSNGWQETITETDFEKTNSPQLYYHDDKEFVLPLPGGTYTLYLQVTDQASHRVYINKSDLTITAFEENQLNCSEIKLLSPLDSLSAEIHIGKQAPIIEFDQAILSNFYVRGIDADSIKIKSQLYRLERDQEILIKEQSFGIYPVTKVSAVFEKIDKNILREGSYVLHYMIHCGSREVQLQKEFRIIWYRKPVYLYEFDLAWRPLKSILPQSEWERINDLSATNQRKWFDDFWSSKDPTPDTPLNEIQYEFYRRVDLANTRYGLRFQEGWKTDRGYTLLSSGFPDSVETNRLSPSSKPYEIWYYRSLKKKITFVDEDLDENYKLSVIEDFEENKNE